MSDWPVLGPPLGMAQVELPPGAGQEHLGVLDVPRGLDPQDAHAAGAVVADGVLGAVDHPSL
eukprot:7658572-Lingulodinium_polyedra.AAC.1